MKTKTLLFLVAAMLGQLCLLGLSGCGKATAPAASPNEKEAPVEGTARSAKGQGLRASIQAQPEPNRYAVKLDWDSLPAAGESWILQRQDAGGTLQTLSRFDNEALGTTDNSVKAGETYRYSILQGGDTNWHPLNQVTIKIPQDREVTTTETTQGFSAQRLFLRAGSVLVTGDRPVEIAVDEIIAEGGQIETFTEGSVAGPMQNGRSGGGITVRARTGRGQLTITARGENGGAGEPGSNGAAGPAGGPGAAAVIEMINAELLNLLIHPITMGYRTEIGPIQRPPGRVAIVGNKPPPPPFDPVWKAIYRCKSVPGPGLIGSLGSPGQEGTPGGNGGATGEILVQVQEHSDLQIVTRLLPGRGGVGLGGAGGPRGPNGPVGASDPYGICPITQNPPAPPGQGTRGKDRAGAEGEKGRACLQMPGTNSDCAK